jgi:hypothetical protein
MLRQPSAAFLAALLAAAPAIAQTAPPPAKAPAPASRPGPPEEVSAAPQLPTLENLVILIRSAMLALHHANVTGNYTVLRDLGAPGFQSANSAARLSVIFTTLRDQKIDLSPAALLVPQMTQGPGLTPQGLIGLAGYFAMSQAQVNFQLLFQNVDGQWRLFGVSVNATQNANTAANAVRAVDPPPAGGAEKKAAPETPGKPKASPARPADKPGDKPR